MAETLELLPCPFCGGEAAINGYSEKRMFYVACTEMNCRCAVGEGYDGYAMPDHSFESKEAAAVAWNTRASASQSTERDRVLEEAAQVGSAFEADQRATAKQMADKFGVERAKSYLNQAVAAKHVAAAIRAMKTSAAAHTRSNAADMEG